MERSSFYTTRLWPGSKVRDLARSARGWHRLLKLFQGHHLKGGTVVEHRPSGQLCEAGRGVGKGKGTNFPSGGDHPSVPEARAHGGLRGVYTRDAPQDTVPMKFNSADLRKPASYQSAKKVNDPCRCPNTWTFASSWI